MSPYELMYIVKPELDDQAVQQEIDKVGQLIQTNGGQVKKVTPWGKRRLAYTVHEQREGQSERDPAPDGDVPIGVRVADYPVGVDQHLGVDREPEEKRQREAKTAVARR